MDEIRQAAYRHLLYVAMIEARNYCQPRASLSYNLTGPLLVDWFQSESLPVHLVQLKAQGSVATRSFELNCRLNS